MAVLDVYPSFHALQSVLYFRNNLSTRQDETREFLSRIRSNVNSHKIKQYFVYESKINLNWYDNARKMDFTQPRGSGVEFQCPFVRILFSHIVMGLDDYVNNAECLCKMAELVQCYEEYLYMAWKDSEYEDQKY